MMMYLRALTILLLIFAAGLSPVPAQTGGPVAATTAETRTFSNPYFAGESLVFEGKFKKLGLSFSIAEMQFTVSERPDSGTFYILSEARSKGTLTRLFNFKFYQKIESTINARTLQIVKSVKRDEQRDRIRESQADFDYGMNRVTWVETNPNEPTKPPKRVASTITPETQDLVSGVFVLRGKTLAAGKKYVFRITDSGLVYEVPVKITGREKQKTLFGKVWCWKVEPEIFGDGRIIEQKGSLTIWITADDKRVPVRAKLKTELGRVDIRLIRYVSATPLKGNTSAGPS
jgi:hypothetical protein